MLYIRHCTRKPEDIEMSVPFKAIFCLQNKQKSKLTIREGKQTNKCLIIMYYENGKRTIRDISRYHMQELVKSPWSGNKETVKDV